MRVEFEVPRTSNLLTVAYDSLWRELDVGCGLTWNRPVAPMGRVEPQHRRPEEVLEGGAVSA